ncbi:hypothetical protein FRC01_007379 [Tulasnella sp. 417]|nr:hypothetical protein FRC01_007379 [Tulasnella sp. 417]
MIFEHAAAVEGNQEAVIMLVKRIDRAVRVLINRSRKLDGAVHGDYLEAIAHLECDLAKIAGELGKLRRRGWLSRLVLSKLDAARLTNLSSDLNYAIRIFGLAAALQPAQVLTSKEVGTTLQCPNIDPLAIRSHMELDGNDSYTVQVGTYRNQAVVVKQYYPTEEKVL